MKNTGFVPVSELNYKDGTTVYIPKKQIKNYNTRIVISGDIVEIYRYQDPVYYDYESFQRDQVDKVKPSDWSGKDERNLARSRKEIRRVIWSNWAKYSKFLTLTYAENMQDLDQFYYDWKMFVKSMSRKGYSLKYLYVLEYQDRGAIHAHVVLFNNEYIPIEIIENSWKHGFVKINAIKDIKNLGAYVCKYLTKETLSEYNSKSYHCSKGLKRSVEKKITLHEGNCLIKELSESYKVIYGTEYEIKVNDIITNKVEYCQLKRS